MSFCTRLFAGAGLLWAACSAPLAEEALSTERIAERARYWESQGRPDLAEAHWRHLLRVEPGSAVALEALAALDVNPNALAEARRLASQGLYQEALDRYRALFPDFAIPEAFALEVWQTQAGTPSGWDPARRGLERLAGQHPGNARYALALATHLSYREETRREAIRRLEALAAEGSPVSAPARSAWRQALIWLELQPADQELLQRYQAQVGLDRELAERFSIPPRVRQESAASLAAARTEARYWLLWGRAQRAQQADDPRAEALLRDALALETRLAMSPPLAAPALAELLREEAAQSLARDEPTQAAAQLDEALQLNPANPWLKLERARIYQRQAQPQAADELIQALIKTPGPGLDDLRVQVLLLRESQQWGAALERLAIAPQGPEWQRLRTDTRLRADALQVQALVLRGEPEEAKRVATVIEADAGDDSEWLPIAAEAWASAGEPARAAKLLEPVLASQPEPANGLRLRYAWLLFESSQTTALKTQLEVLADTRGLTPAQQGDLAALRQADRVRRADQFRLAGLYRCAYAVLESGVEPTGAGSPSDRGPDEGLDEALDRDRQLALARLEVDSGQPEAGWQRYQRLLDTDSSDPEALFGVIGALVASGRLDAAQDLIVTAQSLYPDDPRSYRLAGQAARQAGFDGRALQAYRQALALGAPAQEPAPSVALDLAACPPAVSDTGYLASEDGKKPFQIHPAAGAGAGAGAGLAAEIAELERLQAGSLAAGGQIRSRDGSRGLDRLLAVSLPLSFERALGRDGRLRLSSTWVDLDTGTLRAVDRTRFGTLPLFDSNRPVEGSAQGVALEARYDRGPWRVDLGQTPIGFEVEQLVGGVERKLTVGEWNLALGWSQRALTESLLSYAGQIDPETGDAWGGVTASGPALNLSTDFGGQGLYASSAYRSLRGRDVADNQRFEAGLGWYAQGYETTRDRITYGLDLTAFGHERNLRYFTLGHGGYFSPQQYLALTLPLSWEGWRGDLSYQLRASVGVQHFEEDAEDLFPDQIALQAELNARASADPQQLTRYPGNSQTGLGVSFQGSLDYALHPHLSLGTRWGFDNARDYEEALAMVYLRYHFRAGGRSGFELSSPP